MDGLLHCVCVCVCVCACVCARVCMCVRASECDVVVIRRTSGFCRLIYSECFIADVLYIF